MLDGVDITGGPHHRRNIGMVFQDEQLFPHLDVAANVGFGLRMRRWSQAADRAPRSTSCSTLVGLDGFGRRSVDRLSGGEAKRVALARSLAPRPAVLLLDEPLTGLDRELHDRLIAELGDVLRPPRPPPCSSPTTATRRRRWPVSVVIGTTCRRASDLAQRSAGVNDQYGRSRLVGRVGSRTEPAERRDCLTRWPVLPTTIRSASIISATAISTDAGSPIRGCSTTRTP